MVNPRAVAAAVAGGLLAVFGAGGTAVVLLGALFGMVDLTLVAAVFPLSFVVGVGALAYGAADLATDLAGGADEFAGGFDLERLYRLLD